MVVEEGRCVEDPVMKRKKDEVVQDERAKRKSKTTLTLKSPYLTRVVDPRDNANTSERNIWKWVVRNKDEGREEVVFNGYNILVERGDLLTLESGHHISPRMFMSEGEVEKDVDAYKVVSDALDYGGSLTNPCDADMIIFPVMQHRWCHCVCVNLKVNRVDILDSSSAGVAKIDKYGWPGGKGEGTAAKTITTAVFDYGVITMRHMETYTRQTLKRWDCGLKKGDGKAVNALRTKYCAAIVKSDVNGVREKIRQLVKHSPE
ncbi:hypothetical protein DM860_017425 [Cuscuta australis]|uniref:Ubiquitin-like protease family profile domain-containing protein n=1 Tax=Cuscuta australis TaxID=267555 RepID=A0A328CZT7_9ASTE|nr:hypothetical protein DM860_017425 [Cuscuta australis]